MPPPFGPFAGAGRRRGPPPFVVQILRAPLMLNNIVALILTVNVCTQDYEIYSTTLSVPFKLLVALFGITIGHNILSVMRFHRIRREVFGGQRCGSCNSWKRNGQIALGDNNEARKEKFREMAKRMPSLFISGADLLLAVSFLGIFIWTTVVADSMNRVRLTVAYSTFGALIAFVFNLMIGVGGIKFWFRQRKQQDARLEAATGDDDRDAKESFLPTTSDK